MECYKKCPRGLPVPRRAPPQDIESSHQMTTTLAHQFEQYGAWRTGVLSALADFQSCLQQFDLYDAQAEERAQRIQNVLKSDRLKVAFIAEFSRGKSELINAIFFADYGRRILPSSAGRTTMCPTELRYDEQEAPCIRLLPIETRLQDASTSDFWRPARPQGTGIRCRSTRPRPRDAVGLPACGRDHPRDASGSRIAGPVPRGRSRCGLCGRRRWHGRDLPLAPCRHQLPAPAAAPGR